MLKVIFEGLRIVSTCLALTVIRICLTAVKIFLTAVSNPFKNRTYHIYIPFLLFTLYMAFLMVNLPHHLNIYGYNSKTETMVKIWEVKVKYIYPSTDIVIPNVYVEAF